jgi:predicted type IV restriction endonuclease
MDRHIVKGVRKFRDIFKDARDKDMNEADCLTRIIKFLEEVFEYDVFQEISKEFQVKDRYVDLAVKVDSKVKFYIEAKAAGTKLKESQIYQAESYASQSGVPWVVLTNGAEWQLFHLVFDKTGIDHSLIFSVNLVDGDIDDCAEKLGYLSHTSMRKNLIEEFWQQQSSMNCDSIVRALFHEETINAIKREIRRKSGVLLDEDDVAEGLKRILSEDVLSTCGEDIRIRRRRKSRDKHDDASANSLATNPSETETVSEPVAQDDDLKKAA